MKIESLKIENVGGISNLTLDKFHPNLNIICGENGIGKTNILDSIAHCFSMHSISILREKADSKNGFIDIKNDDMPESSCRFRIQYSELKDRFDNNSPFFGRPINSYCRNPENLIYFKTERLFSHKLVEQLNIHDLKRDHLCNLDGVSIDLAKDWFIKNELLSFQKYTKDNDKNSIELAKRAFGLLNQSYTFSALRQDMEIYVNTPTGVIPYEYLSSGFKTCISIVWGIIREIQIRFPDRDVKDFKGVVLIDEIELHLHPEWQGKICNTLVTLFPEIQFIITTHSPHVIQTVEADQVIALSGQDGYLEKRTLDIAPNGFKGWTIEEILMNVMGMKDTRTEWFRNKQKEFNEALDLDNVLKANNIFKELKEKLHPNSTDLALFRFQLDMLNGRNK
ncbi:hypothetical protein DKK70_06670 [Gilliamella apicola]|uniref:ATPase AAA-type core domain-containing protein n=1 Tax=Gilliamella apicola TaxID=1196095 RepID=A0A2V4E8Y9_9GAMM|nr:AAA family ATPase [Gilliamella apicola]PXZ07531.1 hypothetical protein DKK70_06670 [Gilliamella apicola]